MDVRVKLDDKKRKKLSEKDKSIFIKFYTLTSTTLRHFCSYLYFSDVKI